MKEKVIVILLVLGIIFVIVYGCINFTSIEFSTESKVIDDRYIIEGDVELPNGWKINLDTLKTMSGDECKQVYYDKEDGTVTFVYSENGMKGI